MLGPVAQAEPAGDTDLRTGRTRDAGSVPSREMVPSVTSADLLVQPYLPDPQKPDAERLPIIECARLRAHGAILLCLESGASPRQVARNNEGCSVLDLAGQKRRADLLHLIQAFESRQQALAALEELTLCPSRNLSP